MDRTGPAISVTVLPDERAREGRPSDVLADRVLGFTFEDADRKADKATFTLRNDDLALFLLGEDVLGGTLLEVTWGYPGAMAPPRRVVVKKLTGGLQLSVEAQALSMQLARNPKTRAWQGATRSEVVLEVAAEHGYEGAFAEVHETDEPLDVNQVGETDAHLLARLAREEGYEFFVDEGVLHWHERKLDQAPTHLLRWEGGDTGEIMGFDITSDLVRRVGRVKVRGRDSIAKKDVVATADADTDDRPTVGKVKEVPPFEERVDPESGAVIRRNATTVERGTSAKTDADAKREARARFRRADRKTVKLTLRCIGDATLRAKALVEVQGLTEMFDGLYYVERATHSIQGGGGFTTELALVSDAKGALARRRAAKSRPQGGQANRAAVPEPGRTEQVERVDGESGAVRTSYRAAPGPRTSADPEARRT